MICVNNCGFCKHIKDEKLDGWRPCCDAFPNGIPLDFDYSKVKEVQKCNNDIGYEPKND